MTTRPAAANAVTFARMILAIPAGGLIVAGQGPLAFAAIALASVSDAIDGWLARRYGPTVFGSWLDAAADRLLIAVVLAALCWTAALPLWIVAVLVARELMVGAGALLWRRRARPRRSGRLEPSVLGKAHTALAFCLLLTAVAAASGWVPTAWVEPLGIVVVATGLASLTAYGWALAR
ncbi:MAG: CDP-alcohol phosphatidyltransferase family protein [Pseudomonadota bacterium]